MNSVAARHASGQRRTLERPAGVDGLPGLRRSVLTDAVRRRIAAATQSETSQGDRSEQSKGGCGFHRQWRSAPATPVLPALAVGALAPAHPASLVPVNIGELPASLETGLLSGKPHASQAQLDHIPNTATEIETSRVRNAMSLLEAVPMPIRGAGSSARRVPATRFQGSLASEPSPAPAPARQQPLRPRRAKPQVPEGSLAKSRRCE